MREVVKHGDRTYWLQSSGRYFQSGNKDDTERLLHRRIWSDANGPIPEGHHIHHINGDWRDNDLSNLECVLGVEHSRAHMLERVATPEGRAATMAALELARAAAKEWHGSEEGLAWHSQQGVRSWANRSTVTKTCTVCEASYETFDARSRFCTSACAQREGFRRYFTDSRQCAWCGTSFAANRHRPTRCCSRTCGNRHRAPLERARA